MEKEKQIEEMRDTLANINETNGIHILGYYPLAEELVKQGYKKVVMCCECKYCEVVIDSIIDEPKWFCTRMVGSMPVDPTDYCSRAKMKGADNE